ncbi:ectonucleoside triphosphate diphosphohydrolase 3 [Parambassis ranga]|uniref:Ectonucleoside triphosphate diphosphohydrolase 3 n=1 Tax=Parambassis ranga TaxID=210632 RepID=A0A6P7JZ74_9TELE|nr:ectonucleoside triphosphate diphosphohydrolase 3 [Parambassis ranga]
MGSKQKIGFKCRLAVVLLLLLASIAAIVTIAVIQDNWMTKEYGTEFGIVIDSGSSRSNVYVYKWPGEKENETGVVSEALNCKVTGIAISDLKIDAENDAAMWQGFKTCMDKIIDIIPAKKHKTTPLFLGSTAGMRLLREEDEQRSKEVLASLKEYLSSLPFMFQNASIITGQEEGLYGWITVNYLMGNFLEKNIWNAYVRPEGAETVGSMDLGGASTQIAFAIQEDFKGPDYLHVKLYGYPYTVYTHSFLCYGKNEAEKQVLDRVIQSSPDPSYITNPCYPEGFNITLKASSIYNTECTKKPPNYNPDQEYFLVGVADSDSCGNIVKSIFDFDNCSSSQCSFNGVEQPPVTGDFMAYAGFFYTSRALGINISSDIDVFNASVRTFCHTHWTVLKQQKTWIINRYLRTYCFAAHYVFMLLGDGYKFDEDTWQNIRFEKEVKKTSIGWSLGYMLSITNRIPSEVTKIYPIRGSVFAGLIFLFSALLIITVAIVFIFLVRTCY